MRLFLKPTTESQLERFIGSIFTYFRTKLTIGFYTWVRKSQQTTNRNGTPTCTKLGWENLKSFHLQKAISTPNVYSIFWETSPNYRFHYIFRKYLRKYAVLPRSQLYLVVCSRQLADDGKRLSCTKLYVDQSNRWDLYSTC